MSEHTEQYKGLVIRLEQDQDCESPLEGDCEPTITYGKGSRYTLGNMACTEEEHADIARKIATGEYVGLPVYAYIHSGIALSCGNGSYPFNCPWDSGQSGYIYYPKAKILSDWFGGKILTKARREKALNSLRAILESYGQWLNGENYGYIISMPDSEDGEEGTELDACWGFVGHEYALQAARESADWHAADILKRETEARHAALSADLSPAELDAALGPIGAPQ